MVTYTPSAYDSLTFLLAERDALLPRRDALERRLRRALFVELCPIEDALALDRQLSDIKAEIADADRAASFFIPEALAEVVRETSAKLAGEAFDDPST